MCSANERMRYTSGLLLAFHRMSRKARIPSRMTYFA
jgi:hypothetical protein